MLAQHKEASRANQGVSTELQNRIRASAPMTDLQPIVSRFFHLAIFFFFLVRLKIGVIVILTWKTLRMNQTSLFVFVVPLRAQQHNGCLHFKTFVLVKPQAPEEWIQVY